MSFKSSPGSPVVLTSEGEDPLATRSDDDDAQSWFEGLSQEGDSHMDVFDDASWGELQYRTKEQIDAAEAAAKAATEKDSAEERRRNEVLESFGTLVEIVNGMVDAFKPGQFDDFTTFDKDFWFSNIGNTTKFEALAKDIQKELNQFPRDDAKLELLMEEVSAHSKGCRTVGEFAPPLCGIIAAASQRTTEGRGMSVAISEVILGQLLWDGEGH